LGLLAARELTAPGSEAPVHVAEALGAELGWDEAEQVAAVAAWSEEAAAEGIAVPDRSDTGPLPVQTGG
ncbi:MAG TPA: hypothetical protein VFR49_01555, partial [Solirubrobacteraceae bacterium]|nr:hypothetical protein [Solirubrobacteraceae bacterium]